MAAKKAAAKKKTKGAVTSVPRAPARARPRLEVHVEHVDAAAPVKLVTVDAAKLPTKLPSRSIVRVRQHADTTDAQVRHLAKIAAEVGATIDLGTRPTVEPPRLAGARRSSGVRERAREIAAELQAAWKVDGIVDGVAAKLDEAGL